MEPKGIQDNIAFLVGQQSDLQYKAVSRLFRESRTRVTIEQFSILTVLFYEEGLRQQEIADRLNRDKATIKRVIDNMVRQNLVVRVPEKTDKRAYGIYLTHRGKTLQQQLVNLTGQVYRTVIHQIGSEDLKTTIRTLNKMIKNLKNFKLYMQLFDKQQSL